MWPLEVQEVVIVRLMAAMEELLGSEYKGVTTIKCKLMVGREATHVQKSEVTLDQQLITIRIKQHPRLCRVEALLMQDILEELGSKVLPK